MVTYQEPLSRLPQIYNVSKQAASHAIPNHQLQFPTAGNDEIDSPSSIRSHYSLQSSYQSLSPKRSMASLNEAESGNSSGQDEFHLERYSSHATNHQRTDSGLKRNRKPDLNIVTDFSAPKMPMKTAELKLSEVQSRRPRADPNRTRSVVSQKAVQAIATPREPRNNKAAFVTLADLVVASKQKSKWKKPKPNTTKQEHTGDSKARSLAVQRIRIGLTVPEREADAVRARMEPDSAYPVATPETPAIVITPADPEPTQMTHLELPTKSRKIPVSSVYSAAATNPFRTPHLNQETPPLPALETYPSHDNINEDDYGQVMGASGINAARQSLDGIIPSADSDRPKSQGWWNLMLSPMMRAGSVMSRKGKQDTPTEPVPPLPSATEQAFPTSIRAPNELSPETPRRQGLASVRESTWSKWTEWEEEREVNDAKQRDALAFEQGLRSLDQSSDNDAPSLAEPQRRKEGLAAEYFHACAVELLTDRSYFECENHSCAESWPKLHSIHDFDRTKLPVLASPFDEFQTSRKINGETMSGDGLLLSPDMDDKSRDMLSPNEMSPNVRQANTAAVVKARALDFPVTSEAKRGPIAEAAPENDPVPTYPVARQMDDMPNIATIAKADGPTSLKKLDVPAPAVESPGPFSPDGQKALAPSGAVPMSAVNPPYSSGLPSSPKPVFVTNHVGYPYLPERPAFITNKTSYPDLPERAAVAPVTIDDIQQREIKTDMENRRQRHEKEDDIARKTGGLWRGRGCFPKNGCFGRGGREGRTKRRWIFGIALALIAIIVTSIVLAVTLTRHGDATPVESQWLNLSGYPPMPTGISTIATPSLVSSENRCVNPTTMWSCSVPKEEQDKIGSNSPDQPNFRFEIRFKNGTVPSNLTIPINTGRKDKLNRRDNNPFTDDAFVPNPEPPNGPDQAFLGNTTDNVTQPFDGEQTPFFLTFISTFPVIPSAFDNGTSQSSKLRRRQQNSNSSSALLDAIPEPVLNSDNTPAAANLLPTNPFPFSQPVKLYNRNQPDEHYGFYIYYDKTIYLSSLTIADNKITLATDRTNSSTDQNGGSPKSSARAVCTFSQTRFLVKMFTNPSFAGAGNLLGSPPGIVDPNASNADRTNRTSSAINFERPGSFPYPASITLDRHGGDINKKAAYCWAVQDDGTVNTNDKGAKVAFAELRDVGGGTLINAANRFGSDQFDKNAGGIDGGTGGCGCQWQNFE